MRRTSEYILFSGFALLGFAETNADADIRLGSPPDFEFVARGNPPFSPATGNDADWLLFGGSRDYMVSYSWFARLPSDGINRPLGSLATPTITSSATQALLNYDIAGGGASADHFFVTQELRYQFGLIFDAITVRNDTATVREFDLIKFVNVDVRADGTATLDYIGQPGSSVYIHHSLDESFHLQAQDNQLAAAGDATSLLSSISLTNQDIGFGGQFPFIGDVGVAFQWQMQLQPGESAHAFTFTSFSFPEPAAAIGTSIFVAGSLLSRRR